MAYGEYDIKIFLKTRTHPFMLVRARDRYLHYCHTDTDSQNNATVFQEPFLHASHTALEERTREGERKREKLRKTVGGWGEAEEK